MTTVLGKIKKYFIYLEARRLIYKDYERDITNTTNKYIDRLSKCDTEEELIDIKYDYDIKIEHLEKKLNNRLYLLTK